MACCPTPECRLPLPLGFTFLLLPPQEHSPWLRLQAGHYVQCSPDAAWCPFPGCGRSLHLHTLANTTITTTTTTTDHTTSDSDSISTAPTLTASEQLPPGGCTSPSELAAELAASPQPGLGASTAEDWTEHLQRVQLLRWMYRTRGAGVQCMCGTRFCFGCSAPVHEPANCRQLPAGALRKCDQHVAGIAYLACASASVAVRLHTSTPAASRCAQAVWSKRGWQCMYLLHVLWLQCACA
ncbi:hypothetical protein DUNSADRAFT_9011 [Dunaliella salina]|uniref:IBR domain-containing protein n=1 Tax=Dunaliella salina TaxID=3046 RepID=A0ABQ7GIA2_DUNSA|nr:hypothetical protein DUNSADRAFT_9011 [Dunaliella salina]|eukprot:KAF5834348.1 hypothetical protein DUNSADRAFT_9011 [Dunaliella salina]